MTKLATSPDRGNFHIDCQLKAVEEGRKTMEEAQEMIDLYTEWNEEDIKKEADPEWARDNMEYDLRSCEWIVAKVRAREEYAQNLYAAMCNRDFAKNDVWPLLANQTWSCSWRYAGGIVAHMAGEGDYIDWYCSGIGGGKLSEEELNKMDAESIARYEWMDEHFVGEGHVTDEIRADLLTLGWIVLDDGLDD